MKNHKVFGKTFDLGREEAQMRREKTMHALRQEFFEAFFAQLAVSGRRRIAWLDDDIHVWFRQVEQMLRASEDPLIRQMGAMMITDPISGKNKALSAALEDMQPEFVVAPNPSYRWLKLMSTECAHAVLAGVDSSLSETASRAAFSFEQHASIGNFD